MYYAIIGYFYPKFTYYKLLSYICVTLKLKKMNNSIGNKLKEYRKNKGMTQEQVADYLHLSQSAYARMESGESHSWSNHIDKICEVFEITPEELVKIDSILQNNTNQKGGVAINQNLGTINNLSEKLIEQYEERIKELKQTIDHLKTS